MVGLDGVARLAVGEQVGAAADLHTLAAVGAAVLGHQAHVALARDGHAERAMAEHLDADGLARRTEDGLRAMDGLVDMAHLVHIELARQYGNVGKLRVEAQGLDVGDVELGGEVDLQADLPAVAHHGHVGGNDGRDARLARRIEYLAHRGEIVVVDDRVDREVGLDPVLGADGDDLPQVANVEVIGRMGPHVEPAHAEIDGVGTRLDGRGERLVAAHGGHDLVLFAVLVVHVLSGSGKTPFSVLSEKSFLPVSETFCCVRDFLFVSEKTSTCTVEITQYALKGQKFLAQGDALGNYERQPVALKGQKL